ncbi:Nif3-like dinuclear metal center hexameric protein [Alicyclobacillus dauci]|uniref:GTP cyclohydrolase 1 type 2 homolog n=1 Tax=Alicyclobacillus dauci TaxID=1475485 RepID=A0ABY6Z6Z4_9BACL|nr:Nif3-like dinuclear metal center hexameric protein [Alicyclobacillus dauci]WAH38559.1 Nif3-like dinuclear metal center hexameric protein [Alicyclobacillus dauci]
MTSTVFVRDIMRLMEEIAPAKLAMDNDKIGLQVGNVDKPVSRVWVALEASPDTVDAAVDAGVDMIVTHHALLFRPIARLDTRQRRDRAIQQLLVHDIAVFSAHTNLDIAPGGVNDVIAGKLGLKDVEVLDVTYREPLYKLVVYVPTTHLDVVRSAIGDAGAGAIGRYTHCTFSASGTGTFLPGQGTKPFIGTQGELEQVAEARLETVVPDHLIHSVVARMCEVHPYEEVAYDILPMLQTGDEFGIGRIGNLERSIALEEFAERVRDEFGMRHIRFAGDPNLQVDRVAVLGGSGSRWVAASLEKGAQVLVTSDVGHHEAGDAWADGMAVVDATHAALEQPVCAVLAQMLRDKLRANGTSVTIEAAPVTVDPFTWI